MSRYRALPLLLLLLAISGCSTVPGRDADLSAQAQAAADAGDPNKAEELFKAALEENPENPRALTGLSTLYLKQYRYEQARPLCDQVIAHESDYKGKAENLEESREVARLVQLARDNLTEIARQEAEDQELLALKPASGATAKPLVRDSSPLPTPMATPAPKAAVPAPVKSAVTMKPAETPAEAKAADPVSPAATATAATPMDAAPAAVAPKSARAARHYQIQVGAFRSRAGAEKVSRRLNERHNDIMQGKEVVLSEAKGLTKVQVGPYQNMREASAACQTLTQAGFRCFARAD